MSSLSFNKEQPPPWEVLVLVAHHLDPKTLATASTVSKSWSTCFSLDHLWAPLCFSHFPSLSSAASAAASIPFCRLYSLGHTAALRRHPKSPLHPLLLSLPHLLFAVDLRSTVDSRCLTLVKPCVDLELDPHGLFRFDLHVEDKGWTVESLNSVKVTWHMVVQGWKGVFTMMERGGKGSFVCGVDGWFSGELPSPGCCSATMASGLVADLRLGIGGLGGGGGEVVVEKVSVGVMSILSWRYVSIEDALYYLQHFLLPFL